MTNKATSITLVYAGVSEKSTDASQDISHVTELHEGLDVALADLIVRCISRRGMHTDLHLCTSSSIIQCAHKFLFQESVLIYLRIL